MQLPSNDHQVTALIFIFFGGFTVLGWIVDNIDKVIGFVVVVAIFVALCWTAWWAFLTALRCIKDWLLDLPDQIRQRKWQNDWNAHAQAHATAASPNVDWSKFDDEQDEIEALYRKASAYVYLAKTLEAKRKALPAPVKRRMITHHRPKRLN